MEENKSYKKLPKFVRYALAAYTKRGYVGGIIAGEFGKGKTVTAIKIAGKILQAKYGYTEEQAWDEVINKYIIFTSDDFITLTYKMIEGIDWDTMTPRQVLNTKYNIRYPVLIWDDAGIHASSKKEVFDKSSAWDIQSEYDTIRDITSCMLLTVPEEGELMKFLRTYRSNYFMELATPNAVGDPNKRIIHFYKYGRDKKTGNMKRRLKWSTSPESAHSIRLPDWAYGMYDKNRTLAKIRHNKRLMEKKEERELIKKYKLLKKKMLLEKWSKELEQLQK